MIEFPDETIQSQRAGGKYEAAGTLMIVVGMVLCTFNGVVGAILISLGLAVFLQGRFM